MKKIFALLLALAMVFALAACGGQTAEQLQPEEEATPEVEAAPEESVDEGGEEPVEAAALSYAEYVAAELDTEVTVEAYVQAKQQYSAEYGNTSLYLADEDGAYFVYRIACSQEEYDSLTVGQKIRVTGFKSEWSGEVEITDAAFELLDGTYTAEPVDVTELLGSDELVNYQNQLVTVKGAVVAESEGGVAFLYNWDGSGEDGSDLYFNVTVGDDTYNFTVESDLCGAGTEVYEAVKGLNVGDTVDLTGFLYWYNGPNPHITVVAPVA